MVVADGVRVRLAQHADVASIIALDHVSGRGEDVRRAVDDARCLVAEVAGAVVGFCVGGRFFGSDFLELVVVELPYRRRGVATSLIDAWEAGAQTERLFTSTNQSNEPMQRLCERRGYVRSGLIENLDAGDPEIVYYKVNDRHER